MHSASRLLKLKRVAALAFLLAHGCGAESNSDNSASGTNTGTNYPELDPERAHCVSWSLDPELEIANLSAAQSQEACLALTRCTSPGDKSREWACELSAWSSSLAADPRPQTDEELQALCRDNFAECLLLPEIMVDAKAQQEQLAMKENWCEFQFLCGPTLGNAAGCAEEQYNLSVKCDDLTLDTPREFPLPYCKACRQ